MEKHIWLRKSFADNANALQGFKSLQTDEVIEQSFFQINQLTAHINCFFQILYFEQ